MRNAKIIVALLVLFLHGVSFGQIWKKSFSEASTQATKEKKTIILVFTGSDWCEPGIKLERQLWNTAEFKKEAKEKWVLYKADFPNKKENELPPDVVARNNVLANKYNKNGTFPLIVLLSPKGAILGMTGYKNVSPKAYIDLFHSFELN